jgi:hypothetical protein
MHFAVGPFRVAIFVLHGSAATWRDTSRDKWPVLITTKHIP